MSDYTAPEGIADHPAVLSCVAYPEDMSERRHDVRLKEGWLFSQGAASGMPQAGFRTVEEFLEATPLQCVA